MSHWCPAISAISDCRFCFCFILFFVVGGLLNGISLCISG
jgi:hypothetical protein